MSVYTLILMPPGQTSCVCTTLRMATRSVTRLYDRALSLAGLRATGFAILSVLATQGPLPVSELAGRLAMDRTTCTREVAPLVSEGLIEITAGSDRRRRLARLTGPGERKRSRAKQVWEQVQQEVVDEFGEASVDDLLAGLRRLLATSERLNSA
jgi:DNA-binding MarR family transcriptional regulator